MSENNVLQRDGLVLEGVERLPRAQRVRKRSVVTRAGSVTARKPGCQRQPHPFRRNQLSSRPPAKGAGPASCVAAPLSPPSVRCSSPLPWAAAILTWTARDTFSPPTTPSSPRGNPRSPPRCRATSPPSPSPTIEQCQSRRRDRSHRRSRLSRRTRAGSRRRSRPR